MLADIASYFGSGVSSSLTQRDMVAWRDFIWSTLDTLPGLSYLKLPPEEDEEVLVVE